MPPAEQALGHGRVSALIRRVGGSSGRAQGDGGDGQDKLKLELRTGRSYRFVPAGTAWYRLVPLKFFSPREGGVKIGAGNCGHDMRGHNL